MNSTEDRIHMQNGQTDSEGQACLQAGKALKTLSHFIKNILQMVSGGAEVADLALQNNNMDHLQKSLTLILPNIERLKRITMDLCEYSKVRPLDISPFDLDQVLQQAVRDLPAAMQDKTALLTLQTEDSLPAAHLDADKIRQMFRHFLFHLLDPEDGQNHPLTIETRYLADSKEYMICFATAIPIPPDPNVLFGPAEYKITKFRSGLDLPLAKRLIEWHRGRIELDTRPDGLTVFTVILPQSVES